MAEAYFAKLDENNNVLDVYCVNDQVLLDSQGNEREELGVAFVIQENNWPYWKRCSPDGSIRKNYPGRTYIYDPVRDAFIGPKLFPSWILNETTCMWEPPIPFPTEIPPGVNGFHWNEDTLQWEPT